MNRNEEGYLALMKKILEYGKIRADRTGTGTISIPFPDPLRFNIYNSIPLLTTKKMAWKTIIKELIWFLRGDTDSNILKSENVHIWDKNTSRQFLDSRGLSYKEGILGPGYGFQWQHFGAVYHEKYADSRNVLPNEISDGFDQIAYVENLLKTDPFSRRIFMSAWNPKQLSQMALVPCHISCQFYVSKITDSNSSKKKLLLSSHVVMRSSDVFLGLGCNIFSYAVLTRILAKRCNMECHELVVSFGDCHIYLDHLKQVNEQLTRQPFRAPNLMISNSILGKSYSDITIDDFSLIDYKCHSEIKASMSA
ncbi:thymidylate synthase/dCMP hydroxymethylase domain-containing protein [Blyttiomyces helicus]|uniref:thymidylate synthase n=1 Tax=Blyttiomyces helicus TaxID=388810 RepID=A0A4P9WU08_9FUNG|nr:thymidylate synthase/dCMP hydroxymethylase domain-containing protein [Blyttiomyces helicus]|eukprot:RKO94860.1 thymidylate synthase/dCMP hydroxymethylase domain-containing protein [Blyttiomyces helicus]